MKPVGNQGLTRNSTPFASHGTRMLWQLVWCVVSGGQLLACHSDSDRDIANASPKVTTATDAGTDAGVDEALASKDSDVVFDDNTLWRFDLTASDTDLAWLDSNIKLTSIAWAMDQRNRAT